MRNRDFQRHLTVAILCTSLAVLAGVTHAVAAEASVRLFVAPDGQAGWSGQLSAPNAGRTDGPLPSIEAARDAIRRHRAAGEWKEVPITVEIRGGTYRLERPLQFGPDDGGSAAAPVIYRAFEREKPVITGGQRITGWKAGRHGSNPELEIWEVTLPDVKAGKYAFTQLFVDGKRAPRTRLPKEGYFTFTGLPSATTQTSWETGQDQAAFKPGDLRAWRNLGDVELVALSLWIDSRLPLAAVDEERHQARFSKKSTFRLTNTHAPGDYSRYWVENVAEALDTPGQWYLDRGEGVQRYLPVSGQKMETTEIIAPRLPELLRVEGKPDGSAPATDLHFKGLCFEHVEWVLPAKTSGSAQAAVHVPAAITFSRAGRCRLEDCTVRHVAGYAVEFGAGCEGNAVENCVLADLGAGGVKLGHGSSKTAVENCEIGAGGFIHHAAVGVWIGNSGDNRVTRNNIHDLFYTGVSVGWSWGYGPSKAVRNAVEFNHIYNIGQGMLSDMGGIYTLGVSPGTVLRNNLIHDISAHGYGGWGIYNDEGSTGILIENNVVYRTTHGGYHQHYGKENQIRNNVFAFSRNAQIMRTRAEEHLSFSFEHNIVYFSEGALLGSNWSGDRFRMDSNLYWRTDGKPIDFAGATLEQWQARGHDRSSVIADPLFVAPEKGDFSFKAGSAYERIGFRPIRMASVGRQPG